MNIFVWERLEVVFFELGVLGGADLDVLVQNLHLQGVSHIEIVPDVIVVKQGGKPVGDIENEAEEGHQEHPLRPYVRQLNYHKPSYRACPCQTSWCVCNLGFSF